MGQPNDSVNHKSQAAAPEAGQVELSQSVQRQAQQDAVAKMSHGEKLWDATKQGISDIPAGFMNSLNPHNILPNVESGLAIGALASALIPEGGAIAKVAGTMMAGWFIGKPLAESYAHAWNAKTTAQLNAAGSELGNTLGGMPISMAEGALGAKLGSAAVSGLLSTDAAVPLVNWRDGQFYKANAAVDSGIVGARNFAFDKFGIGKPVQTAASMDMGIIPPYMMDELAKRNPGFQATIDKSQALRDARNGFVSNAATEGQAARHVYDAQGQEDVGTLVRSEGQPPVKTDQEVNQVYDYTGDVRSFYKDAFNRNSLDNKGMNLESTVNYGQDFNNAFWNGERMSYGRPGPDSPFKTFIKRDITGHEMTHAVTQFDSNEQYHGQSGALNEHNSDVGGELVEQKASGTTANQADWLVGGGVWKDGINGKAIRSMIEPGTAYDDPKVGKDPQPAHMKDFVVTTRDNGGVHINSGIPNRAFALFAKADGGNAWEQPGHIWYLARQKAGSNPSFATFAFQTIEAAKQLGYNDAVPKLQKAWSDVGVVPSQRAVSVKNAIAQAQQMWNSQQAKNANNAGG